MRAAPPERRGLYGGIVTAGGSIGQLIFMPSSQAMISDIGAQPTIQILAIAAVGIAICAFGLPSKEQPKAVEAKSQVPVSEALRVAFSDSSYLLLVAGFFVCGFHLAFIGFHLPQFAALCGLLRMQLRMLWRLSAVSTRSAAS